MMRVILDVVLVKERRKPKNDRDVEKETRNNCETHQHVVGDVLTNVCVVS